MRKLYLCFFNETFKLLKWDCFLYWKCSEDFWLPNNNWKISWAPAWESIQRQRRTSAHPHPTHQGPSQKRTGDLFGRKSRKILAQFPIFVGFGFFKTTNCFMKIQLWEQVKLSTRLKITGGGFFFHSPLPFNNFRVWDSNTLHCLTSLCIRKLWVLFLVCFSQTSVKSSCCKLSLFSFRK